MKRQLLFFTLCALASLGQSVFAESGTVANLTSITTSTVHQVSYLTDSYFKELIGQLEKDCLSNSECVTATAGFPVVLLYVTPLDCTALQSLATKVDAPNNLPEENIKEKVATAGSDLLPKSNCDAKLCHSLQTSQSNLKSHQPTSKISESSSISAKDENTSTVTLTVTRTRSLCERGGCLSTSAEIPSTIVESNLSLKTTSCLLNFCQVETPTFHTSSSDADAGLSMSCKSCDTHQSDFKKAAPLVTTPLSSEISLLSKIWPLDCEAAGNDLTMPYIELNVSGESSISPSSGSISIDLELKEQTDSNHGNLLNTETDTRDPPVSTTASPNYHHSAPVGTTPHVTTSNAAHILPTQPRMIEDGAFANLIDYGSRPKLISPTQTNFLAAPTQANLHSLMTSRISSENDVSTGQYVGLVGFDDYAFKDNIVSIDTVREAQSTRKIYSDIQVLNSTEESFNHIFISNGHPFHESGAMTSSSLDVQKLSNPSKPGYSEKQAFKNSSLPTTITQSRDGNIPTAVVQCYHSGADAQHDLGHQISSSRTQSTIRQTSKSHFTLSTFTGAHLRTILEALVGSTTANIASSYQNVKQSTIDSRRTSIEKIRGSFSQELLNPATTNGAVSSLSAIVPNHLDSNGSSQSIIDPHRSQSLSGELLKPETSSSFSIKTLATGDLSSFTGTTKSSVASSSISAISSSTSRALLSFSKPESLKFSFRTTTEHAGISSWSSLTTLGLTDVSKSGRYSSSNGQSSPQKQMSSILGSAQSLHSSSFRFQNGSRPVSSETSRDIHNVPLTSTKPTLRLTTHVVPLGGLLITTDRPGAHTSLNITAYRQRTLSSDSHNLSEHNVESKNITIDSSLSSLEPIISVNSVGSLSAFNTTSSITVGGIISSAALHSVSGSKYETMIQGSSLSILHSSTSSKTTGNSPHNASASSLLNLTELQGVNIPRTSSSDSKSVGIISSTQASMSSRNFLTLTHSLGDKVSYSLESQSSNSTAISLSSVLNGTSVITQAKTDSSQTVSSLKLQGNSTITRMASSSISMARALSIMTSINSTASLSNMTYTKHPISKSTSSTLMVSALVTSAPISRPSNLTSPHKASGASKFSHSHSSPQLTITLSSSNYTALGPLGSIVLGVNDTTTLSINSLTTSRLNDSGVLNPKNYTSQRIQISSSSYLNYSTSLSVSFLSKSSLRHSVSSVPRTTTQANISSLSTSLMSKSYKLISQPSRISSHSPLISYQNSTLVISRKLSSERTISQIVSISSSSKASSSASLKSLLESNSNSSVSTKSKASDPARILVTERRNIAAPDLFKEIDEIDPRTLFTKRELPLAKPSNVKNNGAPIQTNKFYGNLLVGNQNHVTFTHPYSFYWDGTKHFGYGVQATRADRIVQGPLADTGGTRYFYNPVFVPDIIFSATNIDARHSHLSVTDPRSMSVKVNISPEKDMDANYIEMPLVQGMGMVSAIYHGNLVPRLATSGSIKSFSSEGTAHFTPRTTTYRVKYSSGNEWLLFVTVPEVGMQFLLSVQGNQIVGSGSLDGLIIQAALAAGGEKAKDSDAIYQQSAGQYLTDAQLSGYAGGSDASYSIKYASEGSSMLQTPLVFTLPHHLESLDPSIKKKFTGIQLPSTTKGMMSLFLTPELKFHENLNLDVQWNPWVEGMGTTISYTEDQVKQIRQTAVTEISGHDIKSTILSLDNGYFRGKALDKYAQILYVLDDVVQDKALTQRLLEVMQTTFDDLRDGKVKFPLTFDETWGGVTSSSAHGHLWDEFGSGLYNDHHFHYGYYIHAAAIMARVDKSGEFLRKNKAWINALVKDAANPINDNNFPESRLFDWYHGHSWAKGLFESQDSKDQESSSEDYHFSYAMKLWGQVTNNPAMEMRGDLMLQIQKRAMNLYYLLADDNKVMYPFLRKNKVAGLLFENKIDYTTYFGNKREYIHGINMLPITPASGIVRGKKFVKEEWEQLLQDLKIEDGWAGILQMNRAIYDARSAYEFFSSPSFDKKYLDGGQSRTWALAYTAAIANHDKAIGRALNA